MKDILAKQTKLEELDNVILSEECSVLIQKIFPQKLKDPETILPFPAHLEENYLEIYCVI